jgi:glycosyltransferase involved in cell wall biosynthesis
LLDRASTYTGPFVAIVMASYNGEKFIEQQLASFEAQLHRRWCLYVSDDGSSDATRAIVSKFAERVQLTNDVRLVDGPGKGYVSNFLTALCAAPDADFYAVSDQDDIWGEKKLERALSCLAEIAPDKPALYCARTQIADIEGRPTGLSPAFMRRPGFANALVQSIGGGNTMVMNRAARNLLRQAGPHLDVVSHDWWSYQLVSGAGGEIIYDLQPNILYRQHGSNLIGENGSLFARLTRINLLLEGRFKSWMDRNLGALNQVRHLLTPENQALLDRLIGLRRQSFLHRVVGIRRLGIERQTWAGNVSLMLAAALGKL